MKPIALLIAGFLLSGIVFSTVSCQKETDCIAIINCVDTAGRGLNNANVLLYAPVKSADGKTTYTADVTASGATDSDGMIRFTFKLPAIYDIKSSLVVGSRTLTGVSIIKLEEGKSVNKVVTLK